VDKVFERYGATWRRGHDGWVVLDRARRRRRRFPSTRHGVPGRGSDPPGLPAAAL